MAHGYCISTAPVRSMPAIVSAMAVALLVAFAIPFGPARAQDSAPEQPGERCGGEVACAVTLPDGEQARYYSAAPADWDGQAPLPAIVWFHGYRGSGMNEIRNQGLVGDWTGAGYLFVAGDGARNTWSHQGSPTQARDDLAYVAAVTADVTARYPIDPHRLIAAGFSQGGSMVWSVACFMGAPFSHFAPVAGAFWQPLPDACQDGGLTLRHAHGSSDGVVPLAGRPIGDRWHQGDVYLGLAILRNANQCPAEPDRAAIDAPSTTCQEWRESCGAGALQLCLHDGGHRVPAGWADATRAWIEDTAGH